MVLNERYEFKEIHNCCSFVFIDVQKKKKTFLLLNWMKKTFEECTQLEKEMKLNQNRIFIKWNNK